jgi:hypothetical protein
MYPLRIEVFWNVTLFLGEWFVMCQGIDVPFSVIEQYKK